MVSLIHSTAFLSHPSIKLHRRVSASSQPPQQNPPPSSDSSSPSPSRRISDDSADLRQSASADERRQRTKRTTADSTDWIASSLTRRFGIGAGLAWASFLAFGVISEQVKTRFEVFEQEANTRDVEELQEIMLPNGIRYYDIRVGGGSSPRTGDLVVINLEGKVSGSGEVFVNTFRNKKPLALVIGSKPYNRGMCEGLEYVLRTMKAGGKRRVIVPPELGFGNDGADVGSGEQVPPAATLEYTVELDRVSIAPA